MDTREPYATGQPPQTAAPLLGEPLPIELMNTIWADHKGRHDALVDGSDLAVWLRAVAPRFAEDTFAGGPPLGGEEGAAEREVAGLVEEFRLLRDALRRLAAVSTEDDRPSACTDTPDFATAIEAVNRACAYAPGWSYLAWPEGGTPARATRSAHDPAATALSTIAEQAARLFAGPDRVELRACHAPGCVLYFLRTHPRREWCSPGCGNRARVARHYQRHHGQAAR
ncbi:MULTISPECIES: CGNR zinc finger domain-containing protein [unclassified Streptomyces]|uniref:CGNR zinc finger domain-containing protein n=1 Tax=unclassified Streptomyces TaxID=2593676 RepID=UPI002E2CEB4A|nr:ABATE domain-containing protein [Streptomyces sp. NBC_00223]